jgi:hypothetical protein
LASADAAGLSETLDIFLDDAYRYAEEGNW